MTTRFTSSTRSAVAILTVGLALAACGSSGGGKGGGSSSDRTNGAGTELRTQAVEHYAEGVAATYEASLASARALDQAVDAFVAAPSDAPFDAAKQAWLAARDDYGVTEAYRFYDGPIDNEKDGPEGRINAWPLDEAYIDSVDGDPTAGMINDPAGTPEITTKVIEDANEAGAETNISSGWHAVEFLLWGQDLSATAPGGRPVTDYTTAPNADRRKEYLTVVTDLLVADLTQVSEAWAPDSPGNYRAEFLAQSPDKALTKIITGIGELSRGELAGERMNVAYEERSQENEHSCFSDNTTADIVANEQGIQNVWTGTYPGVAAGTGIRDVVAAANTKLADRTTAKIDAALARVKDIPAPFDQWLTDDASDDSVGRVAIRESIDLLGNQADDIVASAKSLGLTIEVS
jgi:putative iron-regulated protein